MKKTTCHLDHNSVVLFNISILLWSIDRTGLSRDIHVIKILVEGFIDKFFSLICSNGNNVLTISFLSMLTTRLKNERALDFCQAKWTNW